MTRPNTHNTNKAQPAQHKEGPGVRIPPPAYFAIALLAGWALQAFLPLPWVARPIARSFGGALLVAGLMIIVTGILAMAHGRGTLSTNGPSEALVTAGPYRFSRNPLYLGLVLLYSGVACLFAIVWAMPLLIPLVVFTQMAVIAPEERYLERAFGEAYVSYRARVRRWL